MEPPEKNVEEHLGARKLLLQQFEERHVGGVFPLIFLFPISLCRRPATRFCRLSLLPDGRKQDYRQLEMFPAGTIDGRVDVA